MFVTLSNSHLRELPNVAGLSRHALLHLAQRLQVLNQGPQVGRVLIPVVVGYVQALDLLVQRHAEHIVSGVQPEQSRQQLDAQEHRRARHQHPEQNHKHPDDLRAEQVAAAPMEHAVVVVSHTEDVAHHVRLRQQSHADHPPHPAAGVHGGGVQGVVDLQEDQRARRRLVHQRPHHADDGRLPRVHHAARGGDGHQARQHAVEAQRDVVAPEVLEDVHGNGGGGGGDGGVHSDARRDHRRLAHDVKAGARVEAVPSEPQDEHPERAEDDVVPDEVARAAHGAEAEGALLVVPRPYQVRADERHHPPRRVDHPRARKVHHPGAKQRVIAGGGQESVLAPHPVHHCRRDEAREDERDEEVGVEAGALRHRAADDGGGGGGEGQHEHKVGVVQLRGVVAGSVQEKQVVPEESSLVAPKRQRVPEGGEGHRAHREVDHVLEKDAADVLGANGSRLQHGKPSLHENDKRGSYDLPHRVHP
mmetsp:Transcript_35360/g.67633  ORF Transcript_35360/g.67633 Transcript_35360/m.67633 type:complete len:475 (-) Transcript_35360:243-1667(-)|eukprot:CAMPEP_0114238450 /NCGR_PEP_ID=MMETSP0058-20121206/7931_1 /TAXON_ID=36894 /ORGANISM="Pyramimonas parkeae, CCMP726" /LENGTH=474 /DNA_ID=CAMNT_0001350561 /DNA_START=611 /DNA_END=2035 /DNA_ORIENTATION=-